MKITKTKEVVTEEVEVLDGVYYFESDLTSNRIKIEDEEFTMETLLNFASPLGIKVIEDYIAEDGFNLPYVFKQFILGESGKRIEKKEYYKEREEVLKRLNKVK